MVRFLLIDVKGDHDDTVSKIGMDLLHLLGQFLTVRAPGGHELQENDLASEIRK